MKSRVVRQSRRWGAFVLTWGLAAGCGSQSAGEFSPADEQAVRAVADSYTRAWLANDRDAVMRTLTDDAVLLPAGSHPIQGTDAIERFWWPADGPPTITSYTNTVDEVAGSGNLAFVHGTGDLSFTWEDEEGIHEEANRSAYLMIVERQEDGQWRIARRMWGRVPPESESSS